MSNLPNKRAPAARLTQQDIVERLTAIGATNTSASPRRVESIEPTRIAPGAARPAAAQRTLPPPTFKTTEAFMRASGRKPPDSLQSARPPKHSAGSYPPPPRPSQSFRPIQLSRPPLPLPSYIPSSSEFSRPHALSSPPPLSPHPATIPSSRKIPAGYEKAVRYANGAMFLYGTTFAPPDLFGKRMVGYIYKDGRWGPFDYTVHPQLFDHRAAHMAFIRLPPNKLAQTEWTRFRAPDKGDLEDDIRVHDDLRTVYKNGVIDPNSHFVCRKPVHDKIKDRINGLRGEFDVATAHLAHALREGALSAPIARMMSGIVAPRVVATEMRKAWGMLRWGRLRSFADYAVCWNACQRYSCEVDAYVHMCATVLKGGPHNRELQDWLKEREDLGRAGNLPMRGIILIGTDFNAYHEVYRKFGVPTYLRVSCDEPDLDGVKLKEVNDVGDDFDITRVRCDLDVNHKISFPAQKDLPELWYPPEHAEWELVEMFARSNVPRNTVFEASELIQAEKRKQENLERETKRMRLQYEQSQVFRREKFAARNITTSLDRYDFHKYYNPALKRFFEMQGRPRPVYVSSRIVPYAAAEAVMYNDNLFVMAEANGKKGLYTFLPPLHLFIGDISKNEGRLAKYMAALVFLLPMLLRLVELSRLPGTSVRRFGTSDWRTILNAEWDVETFWEDDVVGELGGTLPTKPSNLLGGTQTRGDKNRKATKGVQRGNGKLVFGAHTFTHLQTHPEERPPFGRLPCNHEASISVIQGDHTLYAGLLFSLNQLLQLHHLPNVLSDKTLAASTIPKVTDVHGWHHTPDFMRIDRNPKKSSTAAIVRRIVLGGSSSNQSISAHGWPVLWSPDEADEKGRRKWLTDMKDILCSAKNADDVDRMKPKGPEWEWYCKDLRNVAVGNLPEWRMQAFEQHIYLRYVLTSLKLGQTPIEFQDVPKGDAHSCLTCRANAPSYQERVEELGDED